MGYEATKTFDIHEFYTRKFEVNVTVPYYLPTDSPGIGGIVTANYTTGMGVMGYASIVVRPRNMSIPYRPRNSLVSDLTVDRSPMIFTTKINDFNGVAGFFIPMSTLRASLADLDGRELFVTATIHDPWWNETNNGRPISIRASHRFVHRLDTSQTKSCCISHCHRQVSSHRLIHREKATSRRVSSSSNNDSDLYAC
jgi:hypothetical protein